MTPSHAPDLLALVLFVVTYGCLAAGRVPGLALDRTGVAIVGAIAFLLTGRVSLAAAKDSFDASTLAVLFGMMLLSALYRNSGLYSAIATRLSRVENPRTLLVGTIAAVALLSAVLTNDVVCFALTPLLASVLVRTRRPPLPFLAAIAGAANLGSALTPIGNPQNILIAQRLHLPFLHFVLVCAPSVVLSLVALYFLAARQLSSSLPALPSLDISATALPLDRGQAAKALLLTILAIALFLTPQPAALTALAVGAVALLSRKLPTRRSLADVDWGLLALFVSLFVIQRGIELSGWTTAARNALVASGTDLSHPAILVPATALLGNLVSNVPAVMLLLPLVGTQAAAGYALALASSLAGNAVLVGSIANLIVAAQAEQLGIRFGFAEHLRIGLPLTLFSLLLAALQLLFLAH